MRSNLPRCVTTSRSKKRPRRAVVLVCVLACLVIVTGILTAACRHALVSRREADIRARVHQTELLLDAGIMRAAQKQQSDPEYRGETWDVTRALAGTSLAIVEITVDRSSRIDPPAVDGRQDPEPAPPLSNDPVKHRITIQARLGSDPEIRRTHHFEVSSQP